MNDILEYLDSLHLSIISNGLSFEEETIENPLGVLPHQFELQFDSDGLENHISWRFLTRSHKKFILSIPVYLNTI